MILERVNSIADLVFKAKSNKYYRQLAVLSRKYLAGSYDWRRAAGKPVTDENFGKAIEDLSNKVKNEGYENCKGICETVNRLSEYVLKEPDPEPVVATPTPTVDQLIKDKKARTIVDELKKKKTCGQTSIKF